MPVAYGEPRGRNTHHWVVQVPPASPLCKRFCCLRSRDARGREGDGLDVFVDTLEKALAARLVADARRAREQRIARLRNCGVGARIAGGEQRLREGKPHDSLALLERSERSQDCHCLACG